MVQTKINIDKRRGRIKKIAINNIQKIQLQAESTVYSYSNEFNSTHPTFIKLPKLYEKGEDYIVIEYIPHTQKEIKNPIVIAQALLKLWNFFSIPNRGIIKTQVKLDNILRGYKFKDKLIDDIIKLFKDELSNISGNYTGIIHRDLHFDHILQDDKGNLYIIDFGAAAPGLIEEDLAVFLINMIKARRENIYDLKKIVSFFNDLVSIVNSRISLGDLNKVFLIYSFIFADLSPNNYDKINWINLGLESMKNNFISIYSIPIPKNSLKGKITHIEWGVVGGVKSYLDTLIDNLSRIQPQLEHLRTFYRLEGSKEVYDSNLDKLLQKTDIIHIHNYQIGLPDSSIYKKIENSRKSIVWTVHGVVKSLLKNIYGLNEREVNSSPYVWAEENLLINSDRIALNSYLYEEMKREYPKLIKREKFVLVEPTTDIWKYEPSSEEVREYRKKLGLDKKYFIILYHGRMTSHKGLMELVMAVRNIENTYLLLAGPLSQNTLENSITFPPNIKGVTDKDIEEVKAAIKELKSEGRIKYLGNINNKKEIAKLIKASDLVVQPTFYDSFNLALLEGILLETPVLTTKVAAPEHYFDSVAIRIEWPYSFDQRVRYLERGINSAINYYEKLKSITRKYRNYFIIRHHPYILVNKYSRIYQDLIENR